MKSGAQKRKATSKFCCEVQKADKNFCCFHHT